ncbi:MFS general substrate transporter [Aspergillus lucknowensis]|uniref:MFS general substrate transporter n=1 Tax=Aspergillus lucknowensis TaxID=176173 RepID=A0ABR4LFY1_9EURO
MSSSTTVTTIEPGLSSIEGQITLKALEPSPNDPNSTAQPAKVETSPLEGHESAKFRLETAIILTLISLMYIIANIISGILAVGLPKIADSINIDESILLWPASVYSLSCGCTLLLGGSLSDLFGASRMYLLGSFLCMCLILACGLARDGVQLIVFRALQGVSASLFLPASVSIVTRTFPSGRLRNIAFATLGGAQPLGFLLGLVIGGILIDTIGWRVAMYVITGLNAVVFVISYFSLPLTGEYQFGDPIMHRMRSEVDWVGVAVISAAFGMLSYVLSAICSSPSSVSMPENISLLAISLALVVAFVLWEHFQEKRGCPALIPNSIWKNPTFTSTCLMGFFAWATAATNQYFLALFFEEIQGHSALQTSLRFIPLVVGGVLTNIATGAMVRHVRADLLIGISAILSAGTPLIMALIVANHSELSYWTAAFPAAALSPIWADVTLTIANLVITRLFPRSLHGLAGGVTNTCAQLGISIGLNLTSLLANVITTKSRDKMAATAALAEGYEGAFWASFAATAAMVLLTALGMRKVGKVGQTKED